MSRLYRVEIDIEKATEFLYLHKSLPKVAKLMNLDNLTLRLRFRDNGIDIKRRKYTLNENYFSEIDTKDKAYFLGLLYADGCNTRSGVSINLESSDGYIIEKFLQKIESNMPVKLVTFNKLNYKPQNSIQLCSSILSKDLIKLGCMPKKSLILKFPTEEQVPKHLIHHFIRGYFDGDGSIYRVSTSRLTFNIVGTLSFINSIKSILEINCELNDVKPYKNDNVYSLSYGGNVQCKRIYDWLYQDCEDLFLTRKKFIFEDINYQPAVYGITKKCTFNGCVLLQKCKGYCDKHYQKSRYKSSKHI